MTARQTALRANHAELARSVLITLFALATLSLFIESGDSALAKNTMSSPAVTTLATR